MEKTPPSYEEVCKIVGQLFIESQHERDRFNDAYQKLAAEYTRCREERDQALKLVQESNNGR